MSTVAKIDTEQIKSSVDLRELAGQHTELRRESATEMSGPCPKCGGDDRFHVTADWFACRQCHEKRGDPIEFVSWLHGKGFREAVAMLAGGGALVAGSRAERSERATASPKRKIERFDRRRAERLVAEAHERLFLATAGEPGQQYLRSRGIESHTWLTFGLGYVASSPTSEKAPAIVLPWYQRGELVALRFRFLESVDGTKIKSMSGSSFAGRLYGGQALPEFVAQPVAEGHRPAEALRTLVLCEGELNAVSVWQASTETGVDVLSIGSESQRIPAGLVAIAQRYGQIFTWLDDHEKALSAAQTLPGSHAITSDLLGGDANDLLKAGKLAYALAYYRMSACRSAGQRESLLWQLMDAASSLQGVDAGTAQICERLAAELGRKVSLFEHRPGVWVTTQYASGKG